jgi:outer membrane protein assembly factor BamB
MNPNDQTGLETHDGWYQAAKYTALVAAVYCVLVIALLLQGYLRSQAMNPLDSGKMQALQVELTGKPRDAALKDQIRQLDSAIRRDYFRGHAFAVTGSYLLLGGIILYLFAWGVARSRRPDVPQPDVRAGEVVWASRPLARWSVVALGLMLGSLLVAMVILSRHDAAAEYARALAWPAAVATPQVDANADSKAGTTPAPVAPATKATPITAPAQPVSTGKPVTGQAILPVKAAGQTNQPHPQQPVVTPQVSHTSSIQFSADWGKNWPQFRGPLGVGVVTAASVPVAWDGGSGKGIRWSSVLDLPGQNSPIVWGSRVFLSGATAKERAVYAYDADTGKLLWKTAVVLPESANTKPPRVNPDAGFAAPTMATDGERVFAIFANGDLVCCNVSGVQQWARNMGNPDSMYGFASSLLLYPGHLVVLDDQGLSADDGKSSILALDPITGKTLWQTKRPVPNSWSSPILMQVNTRAQIITAANPFVIAYDPASGAEIWRATCLDGDVAPSPIYAGNLVFACNASANLAAIRPDGSGDVTKTHIAWMASDGLPDTVSPLSNGAELWLTGSDGSVTCYENSSGKVLWTHAFDNPFRASPLLVGQQIYLLDITGVMHMLQAGRVFKEIGVCPLGEAVDASPAVLDGRIYIRGKKHLFCIGAK